VGAASVSLTQTANRERSIDQQDVFDRGACFLAAITARPLSRLQGTLDAPLGPVMAKGQASTDAGGAPGVRGSDVGATSALASASAIPRRFGSSVKNSLGVSSRAIASSVRQNFSNY
jgi:hypothetical protein